MTRGSTKAQIQSVQLVLRYADADMNGLIIQGKADFPLLRVAFEGFFFIIRRGEV
jgi:hypothetical protein